MGAMEINYLDKRNPVMAVVWSLFVPGLGQLYIHRIVSAFFTIVWAVVFFYYSHGLEALSYLFMGDIEKSTAVLHPEWLLFFPSLYGFSLYDSYVNTVENNKLFNKEQRAYFRKNYQSSSFRILKGQKVK